MSKLILMIIKKIIPIKLIPNRISFILVLLLILSNIIWFELYSDNQVKIGYLQNQIKSLQLSLNESFNECQLKISNLKDIVNKTKTDYKNRLDICLRSRQEIKEIVKYKTIKVPIEKVKVVKELEPCNITVIDYSSDTLEELKNENLIKYYLDHIGY